MPLNKLEEDFRLLAGVGIAGTLYKIQLGLVDEKWATRLLKDREVIDTYVLKAEDVEGGFPNQNLIIDWLLSILVISNVNPHYIMVTVQTLIRLAFKLFPLRFGSDRIPPRKKRIFQFFEELGEYQELELDGDIPLYEFLDSDYILLFVDPKRYRVWIWQGINTSTRMKFISARIAASIRDRYGIAFKITSVDEGNETAEFKRMIGLETDDKKGQEDTLSKENAREFRRKYLNSMIKELSIKDGDFEDGDFFPYPYIFKPPTPPGDLGLVGEFQAREPKVKEPEELPYCKYCGGTLVKGESICHVCGNKVI